MREADETIDTTGSQRTEAAVATLSERLVKGGYGLPGEGDQPRDLELELEKMRRVRQRFFWAFSHELRTPLNVILCYNDLLASGVLGPLNERQEMAAARMAASITQLKELVEGVFELSEIESRTVPIAAEPVALCGLAEEVVLELGPIAIAKDLYLRVEGDVGVEAISDAAKVRRILVNLCANALQMTTEGGVTIRVGSEGDRSRVDVVDTGAGLDESEREQIFEEFARIGPARRHAGLNLALAHRLALLLDAEIEVTSRKGDGSVFSLLLPVRREVAAGG